MKTVSSDHVNRVSHALDDNPDLFIVRLNRLMNEISVNDNVSMGRISTDCGFAKDLIASYLRGERLPNSNTLFRLCRYFNVSSDWLLGLSDIRRKVWQ